MRHHSTSIVPLNIISIAAMVMAFLANATVQRAQGAETQTGVWRTRGFEGFRAGTFGNAGENLYVSRAGLLQRIRQYDFNGDGWLDLVMCNAQDNWEQAPVYIYADPLKNPKQRTEVPSDGSFSGAMSDLNGDGYDDLVLPMYYNGIHDNLNSFVYFGDPEGLSERRQLYLPTPLCFSTAAGDFNGDYRKDLAFMCEETPRLFYQSDLGFEPKRYVSFAISGNQTQCAADDLDGDGFDDLIVRQLNGDVAVYWGSRTGLDVNRALKVPARSESAFDASEGKRSASNPEAVVPARPLVRAIRLHGQVYLVQMQVDGVSLWPVSCERTLDKPIELSCDQAMSAAAGDINGDGQQDLVVACRETYDNQERSWVYWGAKNGFSNDTRSPLRSCRACDVAVGDLDGDGCNEVILCQAQTAEWFTTTSLIYRGSRQGVVEPPVELQTEDARRVFIAKTSDAKQPQVVFANHMAGHVLGRPDVPVYLGGQDGFKPERRIDVSGAGAVHALGCDLNDDGPPDLVVVNASENAVDRDPGSYVFYNRPEGLQHEPSQMVPTTRAHGGACADINHDGYLDLVFCGFNNPDLTVFFGTGQGIDIDNPKRIRLEFDGRLENDPRFIQLADLNNDGWLDLIVPLVNSDRSLILWGGVEGFHIDRRLDLSAIRAVSTQAADLNGDGYLDLLLGGVMPTVGLPHNSFLYIYWNGPNGLRQDWRSMLPASCAHHMAQADFNNDGTLDVFVASYHAGTVRDCDSFIYWNRKGRGFSAADRTLLFTHSAAGCLAADFNGDGWIDLAIANHKIWGDHRGWSAVWWNGPDGFDPKHTTRLPSIGPHGTMLSPGNQRDSGPEEYYESQPFQLPEGAKAQSIRWVADVPAQTWVKAQVRFADTQESLAAAPWLGPDGSGSWYTAKESRIAGAQRGRWIMYRLALGARNGVSTPRVSEVTVAYGR